MSQIVSIGTAVPDYQLKQSQVADWMVSQLHLMGRDADRLRILYERSAIDTRYSAIPDYGCEPGDRVLFPETADLEPFPGVSARMALFHPPARELALASARQALERVRVSLQPTHVISVTCTGLAAPGLDIDLVTGLDLPGSTIRTSVNFMGCYAAFHALKLADAFCRADQEAVVLVDAVELCTLHFQKLNEPDHLLANSLFADGSASALIMSDQKARRLGLPGLTISGFWSELALHGRSDMAWAIGDTGFLMTLSSYIPDLVKHGIGPLTDRVFQAAGLTTSEIHHWAIHPGGRKILESTASALGLNPEKLASSFRVLRQFGNMSSPTVLFVLKDLWDSTLNFDRQETVFSAGFGPGLTLESAVFKTIS